MAYIDPVEVSPDNYKVVLENDHVRVLEMNLKVGEKDEMHSHPSETVYFVTGSKVKVAMPDRFLMYHEEWTHQVENISTADLKVIVVESK